MGLAALLLAALLQARPTADDVVVTVQTDRDQVDVGEPFEVTLRLVHPADATPVLPGEAPAGNGEQDVLLGEHFAVLESSGTVRRPTGEPNRVATEKRYVVVGLAPAQQMDGFEIPFETIWSAPVPLEEPTEDGEPAEDGPDDGSFTVTTPDVFLMVGTALQGTLYYRPVMGFRDELPPAKEERLPWWAVAIAVPAALLVLTWIVRRRKSAPRPAPEPTPLERLGRLEGSVAEDLAAMQSLHYALTALVREATDRRLGVERSSATDDEWLAAVRGSAELSEDVRSDLERILGRATEVKYARRVPTRWATDETLSTARSVLERMQGAGS